MQSQTGKRKRGPYQRRFHVPLFPDLPKTTTPEGRKKYSLEYSRKLRLTVKLSSVDNELKRRGIK